MKYGQRVNHTNANYQRHADRNDGQHPPSAVEGAQPTSATMLKMMAVHEINNEAIFIIVSLHTNLQCHSLRLNNVDLASWQ